MSKNSTVPLTIYIPCHEPWDRTADFLRQTALRLSQKHTVVLILQYEGKFWLTSVIEHWLKKTTPSTTNTTIKFSKPLWIIPGNRWPVIRKLNQQIWIWWLWFQFRLKKPHQTAWFWLFSPEDWFVPTTIPGVQSLYDCVDDHSQLDPAETKRLKKQEDILIKTVTLFFTNSHVLANLHVTTRKPDAIVVQGFDTALWPKQAAKSAQAKSILLMGSLDERVNWELLIWILQRLPSHSLNLAGPIADRVLKTATRLLRLPNVHHHGTLERKNLHTLLEKTQVCLIPYTLDLPAAKHSFPMKVLEFFAYGKPVIASDITELRRYTPYVSIANTPVEWLQAIAIATKQPWTAKNQAAQRKIAWSHRYETKLKQILYHLHRFTP